MDNFARLIEAEIPRLRRYARALHRWDVSTADDLVQDTLARALAKHHLWQPGTNLRAWLFTVMHNQYVNHVRRTAREGTAIDIDDAHNLLVSPSDPTVSLLLRDLSRGLARLQVEQRQAILLIGLEGMSYEEVAQILCIPIGTVRSRLSRGRLQLRQIMGLDAAATAPALPLPMAA
jgi:RNA polymerase sigma-70 factor (ECF subfamily)